MIPFSHPTAIQVGPLLTVFILDKEHLRAALHCVNKPFFYLLFPKVVLNSLLTNNESAWRPIRRHMNPAFNSIAVADTLPTIEQKILKFTNILEQRNGEEIKNMHQLIFSATLDSITGMFWLIWAPMAI